MTATLAYFGGEAVIRTIGIMSQASEAGLFSAESGSVVLGTIKTGAYVYSAVQAARWSWNMHSVAEQIESGTRSVKRKH